VDLVGYLIRDIGFVQVQDTEMKREDEGGKE